MWDADKFFVASLFEGPHKEAGYVYRGLGLRMVMRGSPKGRRPPLWALTHLGTGHRICTIRGLAAAAFPIATEIAECGEWGFDGLKGYINMDPELVIKCKAVIDHYPKIVNYGGGGSSDDAARAVLYAREAAR